MARKWVVNAAPIILLAKVGQIDLLNALTVELVIPVGVVEEIREGPADDPANVWINGPGASQMMDVGAEPELIVAWNLGKGESQVLSWAYEHPDYEAIVDDRAARNCAASLGISVRGTLGIVLLAKQEHIITEVAPIFDDLKSAGLRIDAAVLNKALQLAGE